MTNIYKNFAENNQILVKSTQFLPKSTIFLLKKTKFMPKNLILAKTGLLHQTIITAY